MLQIPFTGPELVGGNAYVMIAPALACHSRGRAASTQAVAVSVSHYMDRDGNFLAEISPRRYFCEQCHVAQVDVKPLVENRFEDVDDIIKRSMAKGATRAPAKKK